MKKFLVLLFILIALPAFARDQDAKRNAYNISVAVTAPDQVVDVAFPYESQNIVILNGDSADSVWIDVRAKSAADATIGTAGFALLPAGEQINLDNYYASGVTVKRNTADATPISVFMTY